MPNSNIESRQIALSPSCLKLTSAIVLTCDQDFFLFCFFSFKGARQSAEGKEKREKGAPDRMQVIILHAIWEITDC